MQLMTTDSIVLFANLQAEDISPLSQSTTHLADEVQQHINDIVESEEANNSSVYQEILLLYELSAELKAFSLFS